jgi:integrase
LADQNGLHLLIHPNGSKYWRLKYRFGGKEKTLALGVYPTVTISMTREKREEARRLLASGVDAGVAKRFSGASGTTFENIAREWHPQFFSQWTEEYAAIILRRLEANIFPFLGSTQITQVDPIQLLPILRRIEGRGTVETAHRVKQTCSQVFRYAIATGRAARNPASDLDGALKPVDSRHHPSVKGPKQVGELMRAIRGYSGSQTTLCALKLAPLLFVRPGELRHAEWADIDLKAEEWRIPAERMKMRSPHIVPLSVQSLAVLAELRPITGSGKFLFPGARSGKRPMSENTINAALRRLGYSSEDMTGHGFRSIASTLLNEQGWNRDAIERQLAHSERDAVRAAYNYAEHLSERRKMMQHWADYLDVLCETGHKII